jgi:hypothetical protein
MLVGHIRKEERQLFETMQSLMSPEALATVGADLEAAMKDCTTTCAMPDVSRRPPSK